MAGIAGIAQRRGLSPRARSNARCLWLDSYTANWPIRMATVCACFAEGLKDAGYVEGRNVTVEYHSAEGQPDRLRALAADSDPTRVAAIAGNTAAALAAKAATTTFRSSSTQAAIPSMLDLSPALTGPAATSRASAFSAMPWGRSVGLRQLVPKATTIAMLVNPVLMPSPSEETCRPQRRRSGSNSSFSDVRSDRDFETAFATIVQRGAGALLVGTGAFMINHRERLARWRLAMGCRRVLGARERCGRWPDQLFAELFRCAAPGRGLRRPDPQRRKPADLPVMRPTKFEFVINLKTAKALCSEQRAQLLAVADEVIDDVGLWHVATCCSAARIRSQTDEQPDVTGLLPLRPVENDPSRKSRATYSAVMQYNVLGCDPCPEDTTAHEAATIYRARRRRGRFLADGMAGGSASTAGQNTWLHAYRIGWCDELYTLISFRQGLKEFGLELSGRPNRIPLG